MGDPSIDFKAGLEKELDNVLRYWQTYTLDHDNGGFYGRIDHNNQIDIKHSKGIILNTRILWAFSRANNFYKDDRYQAECDRAFSYLRDTFRDVRYGGVFWEVDYTGKPINLRKQIYAQAFCIYALSEYYKYGKKELALDWAMQLFVHIEEKAYDPRLGGYFEAFGEQWESITDLRLSQKDLNAPKTTNTHLHILEAYTTLYEVTGAETVKNALERLLLLFRDQLFDREGHLRLFFTEDWKEQSTEISFGHDIEAAWLVLHAARTIGDQNQIAVFEKLGVVVADTFLKKALDADFGVINTTDRASEEFDTDRHWWPQIEAMVGLSYIWKITQEERYFDFVKKIWAFTQNYILDLKHGEWFFRVDSEGVPYEEEDKVGPWKCPYHNSRGLIEILELL
ncbi:MAG: AGE family epimerase/isomerase [Bacteroidota bacterium]